MNLLNWVQNQYGLNKYQNSYKVAVEFSGWRGYRIFTKFINFYSFQFEYFSAESFTYINELAHNEWSEKRWKFVFRLVINVRLSVKEKFENGVILQ